MPLHQIKSVISRKKGVLFSLFLCILLAFYYELLYLLQGYGECLKKIVLLSAIVLDVFFDSIHEASICYNKY